MKIALVHGLFGENTATVLQLVEMGKEGDCGLVQVGLLRIQSVRDLPLKRLLVTRAHAMRVGGRGK